MPRPCSPGESGDDYRPDRKQKPVWRTVHPAPKIGKRVDSKPEKRNTAVEHTHHPWDVQQLRLHIWIVAVIRMDIAVSGEMPLPDQKKKKKLGSQPSRRKRQVRRRVRPLIRCVIFDLDDTLYDCFGQRMRVTHRHAAQAMVEAGLNATADAVYRARMRAFRPDPMLRHI